MVRAFVVAFLLGHALVACGRSDVEEIQREWLVDQHAFEKRMIEVRERHVAIQRRANARGPALSSEARDLLRANDATLSRLEAMIDQTSLNRQAGIDADDPALMRRHHDSARAAYADAARALDSVEHRSGIVAAGIRDVGTEGRRDGGTWGRRDVGT